jgi:hypothetical protein
MIPTDIVVKTYPQDADWLPYLFRSLARVTGYRNLVLLLEKSYPVPDGIPEGTVIARTPDYEPGIESGKAAARERMGIHRYSDADRFFFVDSDCVFTRPLDIQTDPSINIEFPIVLWRTWAESGNGVCWKPRAELALGCTAKVETMVRYPFCFPRSVMQECWETLGLEHMQGLEITDWNVLGNYAIDYCADRVTPTYHTDAGPSCVHKFWSHHRAAHPSVQKAMKALGLG